MQTHKLLLTILLISVILPVTSLTISTNRLKIPPSQSNLNTNSHFSTFQKTTPWNENRRRSTIAVSSAKGEINGTPEENQQWQQSISTTNTK